MKRYLLKVGKINFEFMIASDKEESFMNIL